MRLKRKDPNLTPAPVVRVFRAGTETYADPDPSKSPEEIRVLLAERIPWLVNAAIEITEEPGAKIHTFAASTGKRGDATPKHAVRQNVSYTPNAGIRG